MKKTLIAILLTLTMLLSLPALAQTTAVDVGGKTYTICGENGAYEIDGITFIIEDGQVTVKVPGEAERVLPLTQDYSADVAKDTEASLSSAVESQAADASASAESTENAVETVMQEAVAIEDNNPATAADFAAYAPYGLRYDEAQGALYYQGARVRSFSDLMEENGRYALILEHTDEEGLIDVKAVRDESGALTGLRVSSDADSAVSESTSSEGEPWTAEEMAAFCAPYAPFGLTYDVSREALTYQGRTVRSFLDVKTSNGESFSSGKFAGTMTNFYNDAGEIDVETIRDYAQPDETGAGKLLGLRVTSAD